jgi:hypothetical protein
MIKISKITKLILSSIVIFCLTFTLIPNTSAGILDRVYDCEYNLIITADEDAINNPFLPVDMVVQIPLVLELDFYGRYSEEMEPYYVGAATAIIDMFVNNTPSWASVTISPPSMELPLLSGEPAVGNATLNVKVDEEAIPFVDGIIDLRIICQGIGAIDKRIFDKPITFYPGYLPFLKVNTEDTVERVSPQETARFDIEVENIGNAKTNVVTKVLNEPEDWHVEITSDLVLGTSAYGEDSKDTITLSVKPSYTAGYHNEREIIKVALTPVYYDNDSLSGEKYILSFIVQNRGFSTPGFEILPLFLAFIIVISILYKKHQKNRDNECRRKR